MKDHIGVNAESGLVHTVVGTTANVNDVIPAAGLLQDEEFDIFGGAGYQDAAEREEEEDLDVNWHVAMRPGKRKALDRNRARQRFIDELDKLKASIRAKAEHPFRVINQQFGLTKVRFRGMAKNTTKLHMVFALKNLWMDRKAILQQGVAPFMGYVRPQNVRAPRWRVKQPQISPELTHQKAFAVA